VGCGSQVVWVGDGGEGDGSVSLSLSRIKVVEGRGREGIANYSLGEREGGRRRGLGCVASEIVLWGSACPPRSPQKLVEAARRLATEPQHARKRTQSRTSQAVRARQCSVQRWGYTWLLFPVCSVFSLSTLVLWGLFFSWWWWNFCVCAPPSAHRPMTSLRQPQKIYRERDAGEMHRERECVNDTTA